MRYLPHTDTEIQEMLQTVGISHLQELFSPIPEACCTLKELNLPDPMTEWELNAHMDELAASVAVAPDYQVYVGAGSYQHHIPSVVPYLAGRGEFVTAYTPYQPEVSQGTLQAIYEYQTMVASLLGMDVANASMYDGASAMAEALLMSIRVSRKKKVAVSKAVHPAYRQVIATYFAPTGYEVVEIPFDQNGLTDLNQVSIMGRDCRCGRAIPQLFRMHRTFGKAGRNSPSDAQNTLCNWVYGALGLWAIEKSGQTRR